MEAGRAGIRQATGSIPTRSRWTIQDSSTSSASHSSSPKIRPGFDPGCPSEARTIHDGPDGTMSIVETEGREGSPSGWASGPPRLARTTKLATQTRLIQRFDPAEKIEECLDRQQSNLTHRVVCSNVPGKNPPESRRIDDESRINLRVECSQQGHRFDHRSSPPGITTLDATLRPSPTEATIRFSPRRVAKVTISPGTGERRELE